MEHEGMNTPGTDPETREAAARDEVPLDDAPVDDASVNEPEAVTAQHQIIDHLPEQLEEATVHWHAVGEFFGSALSALRGGDGWDDERSPGHEVHGVGPRHAADPAAPGTVPPAEDPDAPEESETAAEDDETRGRAD